MSSLASQLKQINEKTSSIALNRQQRSKIHSRSLIFDPKTASTQDYDYIYEIALEGLDELSSLDSRFNKFKLSLFNPDSINLDRNVQTEDTIKQLNLNINAFFTLLGPYYSFNCALTASEWLIRRFQANIHNAEYLILSSLPYYHDAVLVKILNVIPKQNIPPIFQWLSNFKDQLKNPTSQSIFKVFFGDEALFKFYSSFFNDQIENHTIYKEQLVFYLSITIQIMAASKRINDLIPEILKTVQLLLSQTEGVYYSITELKLTAFSILSVLSSVAPLKADIIDSLIQLVMQDLTLLKPTITLLVQLYNNDDADSQFLKNLKITPELINVLKELQNSNFQLNNFVCKLYKENSNPELIQFVDLNNESTYKSIADSTIQHIISTADDSFADVVKNLSKNNLFPDILKKHSLSINELELKVQTTLTNIDQQADELLEPEEETENKEIGSFDFPQTTTSNYLSNESDFNDISTLLVKFSNLSKGTVSSLSFFSHKVFGSLETATSFFLRVAYTPSIPLIVRINSIKLINSKIKESSDGKTDYYLLLPLLLLGLNEKQKSLRQATSQLIKTIENITISNHTDKKKKTEFFMENEIYGSGEKKLISPQDAKTLLETIKLDDVIFDHNQFKNLLTNIFQIKIGRKNLGSVYKTFILSQLTLPLPLVFKIHAWSLTEERTSFWNDVNAYFTTRPNWEAQAIAAGILISSVDNAIINLVGGETNTEQADKDAEWIAKGLESQIAAKVDQRILEIFHYFKTLETQLLIVNKLIELLINDEYVSFDPMATLQSLPLSFDLFLQALNNVQIGDMPEQGLVKRRRRSSNSTRQAMAKEDMNSLASSHIRKLAILLEILEKNLRSNPELAQPKLLKVLFKILTDLYYLGNDGNLPILYNQELLATCMLLTIGQLKNNHHKFDSNSIRADLIVNSIRNSSSPQIQNKLLLVVSELAALSPEIILHSVMPIFTFMGAHTIRQDDEFSNKALQQTIAKVIPALAKNSESITTEVEFLLASFTAAFQHIPKHRRVKIFVALTETLGPANSMHIILFLLALKKSEAVLDFVELYLRSFSAEDQLIGIANFTKLIKELPTQLELNSAEYETLKARPVFGNSIVTLTNEQLLDSRFSILEFLNTTLRLDSTMDASSLKSKVAIALEEKKPIMGELRELTTFALSELEVFAANLKISNELYKLLSNLLDLLPLPDFVDSVIEFLDVDILSDNTSINVAKNYAILAARKFETLSKSLISKETVNKLLDVLLKGIKKNLDPELQQSYLDTFAIVAHKFGEVDMSSLNILTTDCGLLNDKEEVVISAISAIISIVNIYGVKTLGLFPKIIPPALKIWEKSDSLTQESILLLLSCYIKKIPAFMVTTLDSILVTILNSETDMKAPVLQLIIDHMDTGMVLKSLCNVWTKIYTNAANIGHYLNTMQKAIDKLDKKTATQQGSMFMKWLINAFEFRQISEFDQNAIGRIESSVHSCAISYVMKLNDKSFRPLFANLVRWATDGEGSSVKIDLTSRLLSFYKFFNKLQEQLKSIVTSYYSYVMDATTTSLKENAYGDVSLRRLILISLSSSFNYDQDEYWSQQGRFDSICQPLISQLKTIEDSIGKYLVKAIAALVSDVTSNEYNEIVLKELLQYVSYDNENSSKTKIWTIKSLKLIFQKMGEQWLPYLPTLVPHIAELLEDDDEAVELEVREGLVRGIEKVLGEPLDRYLN
ncbi:UTP10 [Candida pseudojiufengensis]|uniref:UTP10 n=1 Tax=Candida pseudojiufengensis TaxID=497109 RepID=UPI002225627E|nr:UTP10 [Candida pseudojiufengensis]KAI5962177.1 UTP10 [Candida pseudojiufengensis]